MYVYKDHFIEQFKNCNIFKCTALKWSFQVKIIFARSTNLTKTIKIGAEIAINICFKSILNFRKIIIVR